MSTPAKIFDYNLPTVALVGRVNVGKSTLFNRLTESRQALVSSIPGTTRTRNVGPVIWRAKNFQLIDTGGLTFDANVPLEEDIIQQTEIAIKEAEVIVFVTDIQTGLLPQERELAKRLRHSAPSKPILLVANKADSVTMDHLIYEPEWRQLGLGEPMPISATTGAGVGDLLDKIFTYLNKLPRRPKKLKLTKSIKVAIMGKPNVGKSSLFNKLIGEERVIVNAMPHTTREPHDILVEIRNSKSEIRNEQARQQILFIDTAGIRRKTKVTGELEKIGISKSIATINKSDIVLLILDASEPVTDQDQQLAGLLREHTRSVIIVINKWDAAEDNSDQFRNEVKKDIYKSFPHLDFAPIVFVSAKTSYRVHQIFPLIKQAWEARQIVVPDDTLREFIKGVVKKHLPTRGRGVRHPKVLGMTQLGFNPPMFEIKVKTNTSMHISYVHYIENKMRERFGFFASPIVMKLSKMKKNE